MDEELVIKGALMALGIFWVVVWTARRAFRRFVAACNGGTDSDVAAGIAWLYPSAALVYYLYSKEIGSFIGGLF